MPPLPSHNWLNSKEESDRPHGACDPKQGLPRPLPTAEHPASRNIFLSLGAKSAMR
jgi:hypothetical protein